MRKLFFIAIVVVSSFQFQAIDSSIQSNKFDNLNPSHQLVTSAIKKSRSSQSHLPCDEIISCAQACGVTKSIRASREFKTLPNLKKAVALQYLRGKKIAAHADEDEGFLENSLVKIPSGYKQIQDLAVGDIIYGPGNSEKIIVDTFEHQAPQFVRLTKNNEIIHAACHQKFYLPQHNRWISAQDLRPSDIVLSTDNQHISFDAIDIIDQNINLHCITVQDHLFKVSSQDILVHNMAPIAIPYLILNFIEMSQPVLIILGSTISLRHASSYSPFQDNNGIITYGPSQEKLSFDFKYNKLESAKKELTDIHNSLKSINCIFKDQPNLLICAPTKQNNAQNLLNITTQMEGELNFEARAVLTEARQQKLEDLQEDICNLQISIGLYINEFFYRQDETVNFYNEFHKKATDPFYRNRKLNPHCSYDIAKTYYEHFMICDMFMLEIEDRMKELSTIIQIFEKYNENNILAKTSNIFPQLVKEKSAIENNRAAIKATREKNETTKNILRNYFQNRPPDVTREVAATKIKLHNHFQNTMKNRSQGRQYEKIDPPFKGPNNNDDDKEIPRIYVGAKYHAKNATSVKSAAPKNGQAALDFSFPIGPRIRVGVSENQIVVLARTLLKPQGGSEWHGYATTWDDLNYNQESDIIKILKRNGLVKNNGKIL